MKKLIGIILIIWLTGCKDTHCPAFPPSLLDYFPYSKGEELRFDNEDGDTLLLVVTNSWASDAYSFEWNCKCSCGANAGFETSLDESFLVSIKGSIELSNDTKVSIISCSISDGIISSDDFFFRVNDINPFIEENNILFGDILLLENNEYFRYNNLLIAKTKGIVEFWDYKNNCLWKKIE
jgi:hypothetical protein